MEATEGHETISGVSHPKCGAAYKAFVLRALSSGTAHLTPMCIRVVLHEDFEVSSIVNRFNDSFEAGSWNIVRSYAIRPSKWRKACTPSSGVVGVNVEPSLSSTLSDRNAYRER